MGRFNRINFPVLPALTVIVLAATVLRLAHLPTRGLIYWDESKFLLEGVRLETGLRILTGVHAAFPTGKAIGTAKPTHALLIALAFALFGIHDYSALWLNAGSAIMSVILIYRIATLLFDAPTGLVAALVLAVSEYDVIYARSALSESDANVILLFGVLLWLYERKKPEVCAETGNPVERAARSSVLFQMGAAFMFGLAFTTNYRILIYVGVIIAFDLLSGFRERGLKQTWARTMIWLGGCAIAPCVWQVVDVLARTRGSFLFRSEITHRPTTYFGEVLYQLHQGKQAAVQFSPLPYLQWYVAYEGWILAGLLALGIVLAVQRHTFAWLAALLPVGLPYLVYIWAPVIVPRNLASAVPFAAVLIAAALVHTVRRLAAARWFVPVLFGLMLLVGVDGIQHSWRLSAERSGFTLASEFVASQQADSVLTTSEIPVFYLRGSNGRCRTASVPHTFPQLAADVHVGFSYAIMDHYSWPVAQYIHLHMRRIVRYPATRTTSIGENLIAAENTHPPRGPYPIPYVDVFQLNDRRLPTSPHARADVCDLNVL